MKETQHNLLAEYGSESAIQKYRRITTGENTSWLAFMKQEFILSLLGGLPGILGLAFRKAIYALSFRGIDFNSTIGRHTTIRCPDNLFLEKGVVIDDFVQLIASSRNAPGIHVGENTFIRSYAMLNAGPPSGQITIGKNSSIGQGTVIYGNGGISIGNNVMIAGQCFIVASSHNFDNPDIPMRAQGITVKGIDIHDNVWIGAGAKILDGVTIEEGAIVGSNSVVTKHVPRKTKVGGVPARIIGRVD